MQTHSYRKEEIPHQSPELVVSFPQETKRFVTTDLEYRAWDVLKEPFYLPGMGVGTVEGQLPLYSQYLSRPLNVPGTGQK